MMTLGLWAAELWLGYSAGWCAHRAVNAPTKVERGVCLGLCAVFAWMAWALWSVL